MLKIITNREILRRVINLEISTSNKTLKLGNLSMMKSVLKCRIKPNFKVKFEILLDKEISFN